MHSEISMHTQAVTFVHLFYIFVFQQRPNGQGQNCTAAKEKKICVQSFEQQAGYTAYSSKQLRKKMLDLK